LKRYQPSRWLTALAILLALAIGAWTVNTVSDTNKVADMTKSTKTICVGRMLIDLPAEAHVELYSGWIEGFNITARLETSDAFAARVTAREIAIRAKPALRAASNNLETVRNISTTTGLTGKIFIHGRNRIETTRNRGIDVERFTVEGIDLEAHLHGDGVSIDVSAEDYDPDKVVNLPKLVAKIVPNRGNDIPEEPGFCIDYAYLRDPLTAEQRERINMAAVLPSHPDIHIRFDTAAGTKPEADGLLKRNTESHARAPYAVNIRFTQLRAAARTIGGFHGDELAERILEENFTVVYGFEWESIGKVDDVLSPDMTLILATGRSRDGPVTSSLSQHAALALWDKISSSVRIRTSNPPSNNQADQTSPPNTPLGTIAIAGDTCVQTGWWLCADPGNGIRVQGGLQKYILLGERMPQALLLPPQTIWEKLKGLQRSYEADSLTAWALADKRRYRRVASNVPLVPAAGSPSQTTDSSSVTIGTHATTGAPCPASGWWRCSDMQALDGARWFAQGCILPDATFAVPQGVFKKSASAPTSMRRRAIWQLVRLARAPAPPISADTTPGDIRDKGMSPATGGNVA
jgi:hypothetical protein